MQLRDKGGRGKRNSMGQELFHLESKQANLIYLIRQLKTLLMLIEKRKVERKHVYICQPICRMLHTYRFFQQLFMFLLKNQSLKKIDLCWCA